MTTHEALSRALERATETGLRVPCAGRADEFTSDDADVLSAAAAECDGCPAMAECAAVGHLEKWGVWGGLDR
ncbi:transcription factor WhiB, partial [Intrasporangium chromatireducens Q5-1]